MARRKQPQGKKNEKQTRTKTGQTLYNTKKNIFDLYYLITFFFQFPTMGFQERTITAELTPR